MERTLVLIKPDAMQRGLAGSILGRLEEKGLKIVGLKMVQMTTALLEDHYSHLKDKPFFPGICSFMTSTPIIAACIEGLEAVDVVRSMCGVTNAREALPGTIRGDLAMSIQANLVHASDSVETAGGEVARFFSAAELFVYARSVDATLYAPDEQ